MWQPRSAEQEGIWQPWPIQQEGIWQPCVSDTSEPSRSSEHTPSSIVRVRPLCSQSDIVIPLAGGGLLEAGGPICDIGHQTAPVLTSRPDLIDTHRPGQGCHCPHITS